MALGFIPEQLAASRAHRVCSVLPTFESRSELYYGQPKLTDEHFGQATTPCAALQPALR
jgi:hypothetical protein